MNVVCIAVHHPRSIIQHFEAGVETMEQVQVGGRLHARDAVVDRPTYHLSDCLNNAQGIVFCQNTLLEQREDQGLNKMRINASSRCCFSRKGGTLVGFVEAV